MQDHLKPSLKNAVYGACKQDCPELLAYLVLADVTEPEPSEEPVVQPDKVWRNIKLS